MQTFSAQAEVSTCARLFWAISLAFGNSHLGQFEEGWPLFEWRRMMRFGHLTVRAALSAAPAIVKHAEMFADFNDTAALIAELDLVISVDCVISRLAGAMGKPVWILLAPTRISGICATLTILGTQRRFFAPSANGRLRALLISCSQNSPSSYA